MTSSEIAADPPADGEAFRAAVQRVLDGFLDVQSRRLEPLGDDAMRLLPAARSAVSGGKRLRAAFCSWGFRAVRDDAQAGEEEALLRAAAALELLHASALVHDDYMDDSDTRRGRPATHRAFADHHREHGWSGDAERYGAAAAILLGDLLLSWSDELLRSCGLDHATVVRALRYFDLARSEVIAGQFLDVSIQAHAESAVETAMRVLRYKSAKYSVERPLHVGAALAGADENVLGHLTEFGLPLGEAFQLRDDLLGVFGDPAATGKPAGDDLVEGKRTVLVALALDGSCAADAELLESSLGSPLEGSQIERLREVIVRSHAPTRVEKMIGELTDRSLAALDEAPVREPARQALRRLALAATQRTG